MCPAPIQTDGGVEWEDVLKKSLWNQAYTFFYLVIYWIIWVAGRFFWKKPRLWEVFLSNGAMIAQLLLIAWIVLELFLGLRVVRYRKKCRRAAEDGSPMPVPGRRSARFRGAMPLVYAALGVAIALSILSMLNQRNSSMRLGGRLSTGHSVLIETAEYRRFSDTGDLWVEYYDCKTSWLAERICSSLRSDELNEEELRQNIHSHWIAELVSAEMGYDQAWIYEWADGKGLIFRQGNRVAHLESETLDITNREVADELLEWLEQAACAMDESVVA